MNDTTRKMGMTLGSIALVALVGCAGHETKPAPKTPQQSTSPTFESSAPSATPTHPEMGTTGESWGQEPSQGAYPQNQPGMQGQQGMQNQPGMQGQQGMQNQPGMQGQQGMQNQPGMQGQQGMQPEPGATGMTTPPVNYTELCSSLTSEANIRVDNVAQNGVALILTPKAGWTIDSLRDKAQEVEHAMTTAGTPGLTTEGECRLFKMAMEPGTTTQLTEGGKSIKIVVTTSGDPAAVKSLRKDAHDFVQMKK